MKKLIIILIVCVLLFFFGWFSCASRKSEPIQQKNFVVMNEDVRKGQEHFMHHCQKCHPGGEAGLGPSINAIPVPMFVKKFQVRHGLGVMPAFSKEEISQENLNHIASYLKALKKF